MAKRKILDLKTIFNTISWRIGSLALIGMLCLNLMKSNGFDQKIGVTISVMGFLMLGLAYYRFKKEAKPLLPFQLSVHFRVWYLVGAIVLLSSLLFLLASLYLS